MKKFLILGTIILTSVGICFSAGVHWDYSTSGQYKLLDSDGNTMLTVVDDGTSGELEITELDIAGNVDIDGTIDIDGDVDVDGLQVDELLDVNEDVDIDFDAADEEFNITQSSENTTVATIYGSDTDLGVDTVLLSLDLKDNGDANGIFLRCRDNSAANTVLSVGADGAMTIDASGGGSGTVLSEATLIANDAAFRIDSETQDLQIGDGTNNTVVSDNGALSQTGTATLTIQDGSDLICSANPDLSPFLSASSNDTTTGVISFSNGIDVDEDIDVDFNAADEEISVINSAAYSADGAMLTLNDTNATPTATAYLLRARYTVNGDTNARFAVFEDNRDSEIILKRGSPVLVVISIEF